MSDTRFNNTKDKKYTSPQNSGLLVVHIKSATDLIPSDLSGYSDPYCIFKLANQRATTKIQKQTLNPVWKEDVNFVVENKNEKLVILVMDKDLAMDDFIGTTQIDFSHLVDFEETPFELPLSKVTSGTLSLVLRWIGTQSNSLNSDEIVDRYGFTLPSNVSVTTESLYHSNDFPNLSAASQTGIPFCHKGDAWKLFASALYPKKDEKLLNYSVLKNRTDATSKPVVHQIDLDLPRTFPSHPGFSLSTCRDALKRLLVSYSVHNQALGYCQAMNFLAGALLLNLTEEKAFFMLCLLVDDIFPEYWTQTMIGVQIDLLVLEKLVAEKMPDLAKHLEEVGANLSVMGSSWFMSLFLNLFPFPTAMRLWDYIFTKGAAAIVIIGFSLLQLFSEKLLRLDDLVSVHNYIQDECKRMYQWENIVSRINSVFTPSIEKVQKYQKAFREGVVLQSKQHMISSLKSSNLTIEELESMYQQFMKLPNALRNGALSTSQFLDFLRQFPLGKFLDEKPTLKDLYVQHFDINKDGSISFKEFCVGMAVLAKGTTDEKINFAFTVYDDDNNSTIEKREMEMVFDFQYKMMGFGNTMAMALHQTSLIFAQYDKDNDQVLSLEEFKQAAKNEPILLRQFQWFF